MLKQALVTVLFLLLTLATQANSATIEAKCNTMWMKADVNKNGVLEGDEATKFLDAIDKSGKIYDANSDRRLDKAEFMKACKDSIFNSIK